MNEDISKDLINNLIDIARINNINMFDIYYNNNKFFDFIFIFYVVNFAKGCLQYIDKMKEV